jgi:hypothetical protein
MNCNKFVCYGWPTACQIFKDAALISETKTKDIRDNERVMEIMLE